MILSLEIFFFFTPLIIHRVALKYGFLSLFRNGGRISSLGRKLNSSWIVIATKKSLGEKSVEKKKKKESRSRTRSKNFLSSEVNHRGSNVERSLTRTDQRRKPEDLARLQRELGISRGRFTEGRYRGIISCLLA